MAGAFAIPPKSVLLERHRALQSGSTAAPRSTGSSGGMVGKASSRSSQKVGGKPSGKRRLIFGNDDGSLLGS